MSAWPMFSSLSLPDDSLTINIPPAIIICSYDTHTVSYPAYDRVSKHDRQTFTSTLWLSCRSSQAVLWYFASALKITFSRTVMVHFCCTWPKYRDILVPEVRFCILPWLPFEVLSTFPEILNISCLQSFFLWAPLSRAGWPLLLFHRCWQTSVSFVYPLILQAPPLW